MTSILFAFPAVSDSPLDMNSQLIRKGGLFSLLLFWLATHSPQVGAATPKAGAAATREMASAANRFLEAWSAPQRSKAWFENFNDDQRKDWHFIPKARKGIPLKELSPAQARLALGLLSSGMSSTGYLKAMTIMSLEDVLLELEKGKGPVRDPELYYVSIFGNVSDSTPWGWRVEGHHFAVNCSVVGPDEIRMTPAFFGSNPARVLNGPRKGLKTLAEEEDEGRALVKSLDDKQLIIARFSEKAPADILSAALRKAAKLSPLGIPAGQLNMAQQEQLKKLVRAYLFRHRSEVAVAEFARIEADGWKKVCFAWAGGLEPGQAHYYRVQGDRFLLEYDNIQNDNNHVHSVWRDFENDFGEDLLLKHYQSSSHK